MDATARPIRVDAARSGRPSRRDRTYRPDELVRVEMHLILWLIQYHQCCLTG